MSNTKADDNDTIYMSSQANYTDQEVAYFANISKHFDDASGTVLDKLQTFTRFVPRQALATFMVRQELFKCIQNTHGHIIECGVFRGAGLFSWAQLSSIYEPYNHTRRILGFDTFSGFPSLSEHDGSSADLPCKHVGGLTVNSKDEIERSVEMYNMNRFISKIPRVELVEGDASYSIPNYINSNKHLVVSLLYLDFDLYEPTKIAIESFWPRMPIGSVIAFDELNQKQWPGETQAVMDSIGIGSLEIRRFEFNPQISYAIKK